MDIEVVDAQLTVEGAQRWWNLLLEVTPDGGQPYQWSHKFPEDIFEWRVAEYGFDPADRDTLLEVVLYEPYMDHPETGVPVDPEKRHHTAATRQEAREHHLERLAQRKGKGRVRGRRGRAQGVNAQPSPVAVASEADDPTDVIKREMPLSHPHIAVKREAVDQLRAHHARRQRTARTATPAWTRESPEQLRARLLPDRRSD